MAGLKLEHIYKVYPNGIKAVSDFTMDIKDQEFIVFVGPSGCGKSTTLRMIAGLEEISAGELYIDDRIVNEVEPKERDIAMVFQNYALYPHMTVYENMAFGLKLRHVPNEVIHEKVLWAANILGLTEQLDRKPRAMSGGQRQRVALGRAILRNPKVMLLDEPLSNLDAKLRAQMRSEISKLHEELKTTFIYVTHDQIEAMTLGTRVVVMKLGKIMQVDTPKNLYDYPENLFVAGFIGTPQMNIFGATLARKGDNIEIHFEKSESIVSVKHSVLSKVQHQYFDNKTPIYVGLRCENISLDPEVVKNSTTTIDVRVSHFEELGSETLIYADVDLNDKTLLDNKNRIVISGDSNYGLKKGEIVKAHLDMTKVHMFNKATEMTINPRVPSDNLILSNVNDNVWSLCGLRFDLPSAIRLENGEYDVIIPSDSITLNKEEGIDVNVSKVEHIGENFVAHVELDDRTLFVVSKEEINEGANKLTIDFTRVTFSRNEEVVQKSISSYDKVDAIFMNHLTVKQFVGDKYDSVIDERIKAVNDKYQPMLTKLQDEYKVNVEASKGVDSKEVVAKNAPIIAQRKQEVKEQVAILTNEFNKAYQEAMKIHKANNASIEKEVSELYDKIYRDEINAFNAFKAVNKDREVYARRLEELKEFKANHKLEKQNEISKRLNLEAIRHETEVNNLKGALKREKDNLTRDLKSLVTKCNNEANPIKALAKEYKTNVEALNKEYEEKLNYAKILFFFKINDLITMSNDAISNKMIQGLGVKVFTKQYLIEIPHDAYFVSDEGLDLEVVDTLDYGAQKYYKCIYRTKDVEQEIYVEITSRIPSDVKTLKVGFDIENIHITEKAMDIKIY